MREYLIAILACTALAVEAIAAPIKNDSPPKPAAPADPIEDDQNML